MAKTKDDAYPTSFKFRPEDRKILSALKKKLGIDQSNVMRQALRALAAKEGVSF